MLKSIPQRTCRPMSLGLGFRVPTRPSVQCKVDVAEASEVTSKPTSSEVKSPEWLPEPIVPVVSFLNASDFSLAESELYKKYVQGYLENEYVQKSIGFKALPELVNGRTAMLGFIAAAVGEITGRGPILQQLSAISPIVLAILGALTAASVIPVVKDFKGTAELLKEYSLPEDVFTESIERVHGRLAMLGFGLLLLSELVLGRALL